MEYVKETLENGLRVIYVPMEGTKTVTVLTLVGVGSRYETKEVNGISHFLEHMGFKGTTKRPDKLVIAQELDAVGAHFNAYTSEEYTGYWVKADNRHLGLAVDIVADIFLNSTLPEAEIEKERGVILGEMVMYEDNPRSEVNDTFSELTLGDQPSGWKIIGTREVIQKINRDDFLAFRSKYYKASNTVVVIAGNFIIDEAKKLVREHFSEAAQGEAPNAQDAIVTTGGPKLKVGSRKFDQAHLVLGLQAFGYDDDRKFALQLLKTILGGNMSSRLFIKIREELGLGYYIGAFSEHRSDHGFFGAYAGVDAERLTEAVEAIMHEMKNVPEKGVSQQEMTRAIDYIKGVSKINFEASDDVATWFADEELFQRHTGEFLTPEQYFSKLEQITPEDVKKVAQDIFTNERLNLAVVGPVKDEEGIKKILTF